MRRNKIFLIILGAGIIISFIFLLRDSLGQQIEELFFGKIEEVQCLKKDLNGDGLEEEIKFIMKRFPDRDRLSEGYVEVLSKGKKASQSDSILGNKLERIDIYDVNGDGRKEIICRWLDGNAVNLYIYRWEKERCEELFSAGGRDVRLGDIDKDGIKEIIEYWRDNNKEFGNYIVNIYRWNGQTYVIDKEDIPVEIDQKHGDRLILGRGKIAVLK